MLKEERFGFIKCEVLPPSDSLSPAQPFRKHSNVVFFVVLMLGRKQWNAGLSLPAAVIKQVYPLTDGILQFLAYVYDSNGVK